MTGCSLPNCNLIADFHFDNNKMSSQWDEIINDSVIDIINIPPIIPTSIWDNNGYIEMKVPDDGDRIVRQTKEYYRAKGHKKIRAQFTAILNINLVPSTAPEGSISRVGMFDNHNDKTLLSNDVGNFGFFFEYRLTNGTTFSPPNSIHPLYVGIRYGTTNSGTDTLIRQDNFNINDLNRHSHVKILDWSKLYTFEIIYNAIGYVEWAIYLDGERVLLHKEQNILRTLNVLPKFIMPIRFEIINTDTGLTQLLHEMRQFNASICVEDGASPNACEQPPMVTSYKIKHLTQISKLIYTIDSFNYQPILSFKLKDNYIREPIKLYEILYLVHKRGPFTYAIVRNANLLSGNPPIWTDAGVECKLQYDINANIATSIDDIIYEQFVDADCNGSIQYSNPTRLCIGPAPLLTGIIGNTDTLTVLVRKQSHLKITLNFGLRWIE